MSHRASDLISNLSATIRFRFAVSIEGYQLKGLVIRECMDEFLWLEGINFPYRACMWRMPCLPGICKAACPVIPKGGTDPMVDGSG